MKAHRAGFTIVELLVGILIASILVLVASVPLVGIIRQRTRSTEFYALENDMQLVEKALRLAVHRALDGGISVINNHEVSIATIDGKTTTIHYKDGNSLYYNELLLSDSITTFAASYTNGYNGLFFSFVMAAPDQDNYLGERDFYVNTRNDYAGVSSIENIYNTDLPDLNTVF